MGLISMRCDSHVVLMSHYLATIWGIEANYLLAIPLLGTESSHEADLERPSINEYLRLIDAYTHVQEKGEVCPANWEEGKEAMKADRNGVANYLAAHAN